MKEFNAPLMCRLTRSGGTTARTTVIILCMLLGVPSVALAEFIAWPTTQLRPPGSDVVAPSLSDVALSGDVAATGYGGNASRGYIVYVRTQSSSAWSAPEILAQGMNIEDDTIFLDADAQKIAVGAANSAGGGKVSIYRRGSGPTGWELEEILAAPVGAIGFGHTLSLRGDLLVVTSTQDNGAVYSFKFVTATGEWVDAGFQFENDFLGTVSAVTDGERIAYCRPLLLAGCATVVYSDENGWYAETNTHPANPSCCRVVGVSPNWLFTRNGGNVAAYERVGAEWALRQQIPSSEAFSLSANGTTIAVSQLYDSQILRVNASGFWESVMNTPLSAGSTAIDGNRALVGSQSFLEAGGQWSASGDTAGLIDLSGTFFGGSLVHVGSELWVGASGYRATDQMAGSVWIYPMLGGGVHPTTPTLIPAPPALHRYFGAGMTADDSRVAVYSIGTPGPTNGFGKVWIYDAASHQELQQLELPDPMGSVTGLSLSIYGDVLAVSRVVSCASGCPSHVLIFRDSGSGFVLAQTLQLPAGAPTSAYFANSTQLNGDWLLSGKLEFHSLVGGDYQYVGELSRPGGLIWQRSGVEADANRLAVAVRPNPSSILLVYDFDNATGWTYSGSVSSGTFTVENGCQYFAIDALRIVCTNGSIPSVEMYLAVRNDVGSDWTVVGSAPIPESARDKIGYGEYQLAWVNNQIVIGTPDAGNELAGARNGSVQFMTLDESIFGSGFE